VGSRAVAQEGGADSTAVLTTVVTEVAANEEVNDEPVAPGLISTPRSASNNEEGILAEKD